MNRHQLKQLVQNNLWYGENRRAKDASRPVMAAVLVQPDYAREWGCDVSGRWDGIVDFSVTKAKGARFAFIKAVDGTVNTPYYRENYQSAVSAGLDRAPYAWLYRNANVSCVAQAQALHEINQRYPPSLQSVIDFEPTRYLGMQSNPNFDDLRKWGVEWYRLGNPKPLLYSSPAYMDQFGYMPSDLRGMFDLFIANYGVTRPGLPLGFMAWKYWQFSAMGDAQMLAPGNQGKIELDLDYGQGTGAQPEPPTGDPMPIVNKHMRVTGSAVPSLNVRSSGENLGSDNDLGTFNLLPNDIVHVVEYNAANYQRFDRLYRDNAVIELPASPTGQYWSLGSSGVTVYLVDVVYTPPAPTPSRHVVEVIVDGASVYRQELE